MPIIKRYNKILGLREVDVLHEETGQYSDYFNITEFPEPLQMGKNSFLIGGSERLQPYTDIKIDILDSEGGSVYHEPVRNWLEGHDRRISIEVYDHNKPGQGFLYMVGEMNPKYFDVPEEWRGIYNVRYIRPITINTIQVNTQPIFFYKNPTIMGREITKAFVEELYPSASYSVSGSVTVTATPEYLGSDVPQDTSIMDPEDFSPGTSTGPERVGRFLEGFKNKRINKRSTNKSPTVLALGRIQQRSSPETPTHLITINNLESSPENEDSKVTSAFVGAHLVVENPVVDESTFYIGSNNYVVTPSKYVTRISEVLNETTLVAESPFIVSTHATDQSGNSGAGYKDENFDKNKLFENTSKLANFLPENATPKQPNTPYKDETGAVWKWVQKTSNDEANTGKESEAGGDSDIKSYGWTESGSVDDSNQDDVTSQQYVSMLPNSNVTMSVMPTPGNTLSATHLRSYIDMSVLNMRTFSGDVFRMKVYGKLRGGINDFELLYDSPLESPQLLYDPFSVDGFKNTGYFYEQSIIGDYWTSSSACTVTQNNQYIVDGALISGSNYGANEKVRFETTSSYDLERGVNYSLSFDAYHIKQEKEVIDEDDGTSSTKTQAKLKVYLSGSKAKDGTGNEGKDFFLGELNTDKFGAEGLHKKVYQTFMSSKKHFPSAIPQFVAESGQWVIKDVELAPCAETNFSPDYFRTIIPLPIIPKRPAEMDFLVEFYDVNNNIANAFAFMERFRIKGVPEVIQGGNNLLSGSMYLGSLQGQGIEIHGGSAFMRSIGYEGFEATISSGSGGFMIWSGSLGSWSDGTGLLQTTESYDGVGLEIVDAHTSQDRYLKFRTNPSTFEVVTDQFFLGQSGKSFVSGSNGNIEIFSSGTTTLSGSNVDILTPNFFLGGQNSFISGSGGNIQISSSNFHLSQSGDVVMQGTITAEAGGTIGGWTIDSNYISAPLTGHSNTTYSRIYLSTANDNDKNIQQGLHIYRKDEDVTDGNVKIIRIGGLSDTGNLHATGSNDYGIQVIRKDSDENYTNIIYIGKDEQKISGFDLTPTSLKKGSIFQISSSANTLDPVSFISSSKFQVSAGGQITGSQVKFTGGDIGGFTIGDNFISSSNLLINADDGEIRTANFVTGFKGWRITAGVYGGLDSNGTAEFENIRVRGTLRTAVFEKETVNAVGGQLWVGNSTAISQSASATDTLLYCDNVSGFKKDEIIFAKKVTGTGFTKEFMKVHSQSREDESSDNNYAGYLHVTRSYGGTATGSAFIGVTETNGAITANDDIITVDDADPTGSDLIHATIRIDNEIMQVSGSDTSSNKLYVIRGTNGSTKAAHSDNSKVEKVHPDVAFLMGLVSPAESYTEGQVLVSTGRYLSGTGDSARGSGYALINANPGDATTPYMDFVERTGSGIYDSVLKTRVGDLSGLVGTSIGDRLFSGNKDPGFGLLSENIFLSGLIKASSGSIGGLEMTGKEIFVADNVGTYGGSTTHFFVSSSGHFSLKDKLKWNGTKWELTGSEFSLATTGTNKLQIESGNELIPKIALGATLNTGPQGTHAGVFMDGTGSFLAYGDGDNYIKKYGTNLDIKSETFDLQTTTQRISSSYGGKFAMGSTIPQDLGTTGIMLSGSGQFNFQTGSSYIRSDVDGFSMNFPSFSVSPAGVMTATDGIFRGHLEAKTGFFGSSFLSGWNIDGDKIKSVVTDADKTGSIEIDATPDSPNITLTSGSYVAEILPDFTTAATILAGGDSEAFTNGAITSGSSNNGASTGVISLSTGQASSALNLYGGFSNGTTASTHTTLGSITDATLSNGAVYKSTMTVKVTIAVETPQFGASVNWELDGSTTLSGNLVLRRSDNDAEVGSVSLAGGHNVMDMATSTGLTTYSTTKSATVNFTSATTDHYWHIDDLVVTNNGFTETYEEVAGKPVAAAVDIKGVNIAFSAMAHTPGNKKVEIAPGGIQAVSLLHATLEDSSNKFIRISPTEVKTFEIQGTSHHTGSMYWKAAGASAQTSVIGGAVSSVTVDASTSVTSPKYILDEATNYYISDATNQMNFTVAGTTGMRLSNAGALLVKDDITGFSTALSDRKFKENVIQIGGGLNKILQLRGVEFDWKGDYKHKGHDIGFIAQEVETVDGLNSIVKEVDGWEEGDKVKTVSYDKVIPLLVEAIKEQQTQIEELKKTIDRMFI